MSKTKLLIGTTLVVSLLALGLVQTKLQDPAEAASNGVMAPQCLVKP